MNQAEKEVLVIGIGQQTEILKRPPMIHSVVTWVPERIAGALGIAEELGLDAYCGKVDEKWPYPTLVVFPPDRGGLGEFWKKFQAEYPPNL